MTRASRTLLLLGLAALAGACSSASEPKAKAGRGGGRKLEYPVDVAPLEKRAMRYTVTAPGSIEAFQQVQITARVSGAVDKVAFAEGEQVSAGQVLVNIESDRFQVALDLAKAQLAKAHALKSGKSPLKANGAHPGADDEAYFTRYWRGRDE